MGTEYLIIILLWCQMPGDGTWRQQEKCRKENIECVRKLINFTTDDVVDKCLLAKKQ